jgi:hypothetical protein
MVLFFLAHPQSPATYFLEKEDPTVGIYNSQIKDMHERLADTSLAPTGKCISSFMSWSLIPLC